MTTYYLVTRLAGDWGINTYDWDHQLIDLYNKQSLLMDADASQIFTDGKKAEAFMEKAQSFNRLNLSDAQLKYGLEHLVYNARTNKFHIPAIIKSQGVFAEVLKDMDEENI
tara:strand:+ start:57 stop:389 length:333 start_codon:yes stop_codon:yes gene_type:complete